MSERDTPAQPHDGSAAPGAVDDARAATSGGVDVAGATHAGNVRSSNEDHFVIARLGMVLQVDAGNLDPMPSYASRPRHAGHLFVVADGVGGRSGGAVASGMAVKTIVRYLGEIVESYERYDVDAEHAFLEHLTSAVERAHTEIQDVFGRKAGAATTLTMVVLLWPRAYIVHVGDSRGYFLRRGRLRQFTRDQTVGDVMVDIGAMTQEAAERGKLFDTLASAVGGDLAPSVGLLDLDPGDVLLLCTDGLTRHLSDERLAAILREAPDAEHACRSLIEGALREGGEDNVTAVVARVPPSAGA